MKTINERRVRKGVTLKHRLGVCKVLKRFGPFVRVIFNDGTKLTIRFWDHINNTFSVELV